MSTRVVQVGKGRTMSEVAITSVIKPGEAEGFTARHEHVTMETPKPLTETQKLRLMTYQEMKQSWTEQQ